MPVTIDGSNTPTAGGVGYGDGTELAFTTAGSAGQVLQSNGAGAPTWAAVPTVNLATGVTGTLPVGNGGTGQTSLTSNNVILGNGGSAVQFVAPGTTGNVLTSDGTTWQSTAPGGGDLVLVNTVTGSNVNILDMTSGFTSTYQSYVAYLQLTSTATTTVGLQIYRNSALQTANYGWTAMSGYTGSNVASTNGSGAYINVNRSSRQRQDVVLDIYRPANGVIISAINFNCVGTSGPSGLADIWYGAGMWSGGSPTASGSLTGLRFETTGGSAFNATLYLYGYKA